jgi:hypothetical protein
MQKIWIKKSNFTKLSTQRRKGRKGNEGYALLGVCAKQVLVARRRLSHKPLRIFAPFASLR